MMEVNLVGYVYGGCSEDERIAVRDYIKEDFYNAFDVIEMMRDRAYEELSPAVKVESAAIYTEEDNCEMADMDMKFGMPEPSVCGSMPSSMPKTRPHSILDMLNTYLARE